MSLQELTLFGLRDKVEISIARLREMEPKKLGYYLAFSGGKDSCVIKQLAIDAGVKFDAHYNAVGIDPPEVVAFIREHHGDVAMEYPAERFFTAMRRKKAPPMRQARWCCELLKEGGGSGRVVITGVRWAESPKRAMRQWFESCRNDNTKKYIHPIIDWSEDDVWSFIRSRNLPYCSLYDEGYTRIGCLMCPMAGVPARKRDSERYPKLAAAFVLTLDRMIAERAGTANPVRNFTSGADWFDWWMNDLPGPDTSGQQCFKFDSEEEA